MSTVATVVIALIVLALIAGAVVFALQQRRRANLQERFGPEYERAVETSGSRREAEQRLSAVASKRDKLDIKEIDEPTRQRYTEEWALIQARFVDEPSAAVDDADRMLTRVMRERGYPVDDFEERAALVAADYPGVVEHYRGAHEAHARHREAGAADTEDLRQSFVHYRALFEALVDRGEAHTVDVTDVEKTETAEAAEARQDGEVRR